MIMNKQTFFKYENKALLITLLIFDKFLIYYVKKRTANLWYENEIPFFRFGFLIKKRNGRK